MTRPAPHRTWRGLLARRAAARREEGGFVLLESIVAIGLVSVLMGALASFTLTAVTATAELRARQGAVQLATSTMASVTSLSPSDLVTGRDQRAVDAQVGAAPARVRTELAGATPASDPAATSASVALLPLSSPPQTLNGVDFTTSVYLGRCRLRSESSTDCTSTGTGTQHMRVVVAVAWSNRACRAGGCLYTSSTLVNADPDPVFNTNRARPPTPPAIDGPGDQVSTLATPVSLRLAVQRGTGLAPHTWQVTAGALPAGLLLSADGVVSGRPTAVGGPTTLTVTTADVFGRTASSTFAWRVVAAPTVTTPPAQRSPRGRALTLTPTATCPNTPCAWGATGLPAGLSIDAVSGVVSGTPSTLGTATVTLTLTDAAGAVASTDPFAWAVVDPLAVTVAPTLTATVGTVVASPVSWTCTSGPCTVTLTNALPGVGLATTAPLAANNVTSTLVVPTGTGTLSLTGTVQASAAPAGSSRTWTPTLTISSTGGGSTSASGTWTAHARPGLAGITARTSSVGAVRNVGLDYTCPSTPCTLVLTSTVPGIGLSTTAGVGVATTTSLQVGSTSGTVYLAGVVDASAAPSGASRAWTVSVTSTDAGGAATTSSGTWTVTTGPRVTNPGSQVVQPGQDAAVQLAATCPNGGCTWSAEVQADGATTWTPVDAGPTGLVTLRAVAQGRYTVRVRVADADGQGDTTTFPLTAQVPTLVVPDLVTTRPLIGTRTSTYDASANVSPQADSWTWSISGGPSWATISPGGVLTATVSLLSRTDPTVTVTATSTTNPATTVSATFAWTVR